MHRNNRGSKIATVLSPLFLVLCCLIETKANQSVFIAPAVILKQDTTVIAQKGSNRFVFKEKMLEDAYFNIYAGDNDNQLKDIQPLDENMMEKIRFSCLDRNAQIVRTDSFKLNQFEGYKIQHLNNKGDSINLYYLMHYEPGAEANLRVYVQPSKDAILLERLSELASNIQCISKEQKNREDSIIRVNHTININSLPFKNEYIYQCIEQNKLATCTTNSLQDINHALNEFEIIDKATFLTFLGDIEIKPALPFTISNIRLNSIRNVTIQPRNDSLFRLEIGENRARSGTLNGYLDINYTTGYGRQSKITKRVKLDVPELNEIYKRAKGFQKGSDSYQFPIVYIKASEAGIRIEQKRYDWDEAQQFFIKHMHQHLAKSFLIFKIKDEEDTVLTAKIAGVMEDVKNGLKKSLSKSGAKTPSSFTIISY